MKTNMKFILLLALSMLVGCTPDPVSESMSVDCASSNSGSPNPCGPTPPDPPSSSPPNHAAGSRRGEVYASPPAMTQLESECWMYGRTVGCDGLRERPDGVEAGGAFVDPRPGEALTFGRDLTCGAGSIRVNTAQDGCPTPESCVWTTWFNGLTFGEFVCSCTAYEGLTPLGNDGFGWLKEYSSTGVDLTGPGWQGGVGAGVLSSPLGMAFNPILQTLAVAEGGKDPSDDMQSIMIFDAFQNLIRRIPLPTDTINDVARDPVTGALYVSESNFAGYPGLSGSAIYKIDNPELPGFTTVTKWLDMAQLPGQKAPNAMATDFFGSTPVLYVASLGDNLERTGVHTGKVWRIDLLNKTVTDAAPGLTGFWDGLAVWRGLLSKSLLVSDLGTRKVYEIDITGTIGAWHEAYDLSAYVDQLGGIGTIPGAVRSPIFHPDYRSDVVVVRR